MIKLFSLQAEGRGLKKHSMRFKCIEAYKNTTEKVVTEALRTPSTIAVFDFAEVAKLYKALTPWILSGGKCKKGV